jgi:hypothetical protein
VGEVTPCVPAAEGGGLRREIRITGSSSSASPNRLCLNKWTNKDTSVHGSGTAIFKKESIDFNSIILLSEFSYLMTNYRSV